MPPRLSLDVFWTSPRVSTPKRHVKLGPGLAIQNRRLLDPQERLLRPADQRHFFGAFGRQGNVADLRLRGVRLGKWLIFVDRAGAPRFNAGDRVFPGPSDETRPCRVGLVSNFEGAIYHVMTRGNAHQDIVQDDDDRTRLLRDLEHRFCVPDWELLAFVILCQPSPPPAQDSPAEPRQRDASLSLRLRGLVRETTATPSQLTLGSVPGGDDRGGELLLDREPVHPSEPRTCRMGPAPTVGMVELSGVCVAPPAPPVGAGPTPLAAWRGDGAGRRRGAYRRYVEAGLTDPPASPFRETFGGWVLGSRDFVERLRASPGPVVSDPPLREVRQLAGLDPGVVLAAVTEYYGLEACALTRRHDRHIARSVAAWLCRRHTEATLSEWWSGWASRWRQRAEPGATDGSATAESSQLAEDVKAIVRCPPPRTVPRPDGQGTSRE